MSRIFGMNNHNTNVHNTYCTHFQMEKKGKWIFGEQETEPFLDNH